MLTYLLIIVGLFLIYWGFSWLWSYYQKSKFKAIGGEISPETFEHTMRKAQIIDLRERNEFKAGHILGARDLPYTQLRERLGEMRKRFAGFIYTTRRVYCRCEQHADYVKTALKKSAG
ncbi:rhodanese-like domain-containing protein [Lacticaseibacillus rhamnosus]|uniref:rhodanese-like domain-containing protein n=1 Tax=Lacticaseibacillus rhamnosus TaxID=47715 RepID=UPI0009BFA375|nr:rhodanese-like domain-containing protein [Lacticaseibacillus rhamnosus]